MKNVVMINSQSGNILNVKRAFEYCGCDVTVSQDDSTIKNADYLILPGVGSFDKCMEILNGKHISESIHNFLNLERPFLGICVGMQVMFEIGYEFAETSGLGLFAGEVIKIPPTYDYEGRINAVPHIGWYKLQDSSDHRKLFHNTDGVYCYFVHSYMAKPKFDHDIYATYSSGNLKIPAMIKKNNILGCQFHLEKSGKDGLNIINEFLKM